MNKFRKTFFSLFVMVFVFCSYAEELQPQQITSCENQYYLDYYAKLAEVVNRLHYVILGYNRVWCPGYYSSGSSVLDYDNYSNRPSPVQKGKSNGIFGARIGNSLAYWQDRSGGKPGIYDAGIDVIIYEQSPGSLTDGLPSQLENHVYYYDKNNNDLYDSDEFAWTDRNMYKYDQSTDYFNERCNRMNFLLYRLRQEIYYLYTGDNYSSSRTFINSETIPEDLTNTTTPSTDIPHLIEYDEAGNVLPGSVKLFPERSGDAAYMFTKIPTHLEDGTQIADSPEYAENWKDVPVLKIHFDEIREVLNRNDLKWTLHTGEWSARGEDNYKSGSASQYTFSDAYNSALSNYNNSSSSTDASPMTYGVYHRYGAFDVHLQRRYSYLTLSDNIAPLTRTVDFYIMGKGEVYYYGDSTLYLFNANGDPVLDGEWNRFAQHINSNADEEYAKVGNLDVPVLGNEDEHTGYAVKDYMIICKWDLPTINISEFSPLSADVPDTERDGRYDIGIDFADKEFATGNFVHLPDKDSPQLFIPVRRYFPTCENDKTLWSYIGQGNRNTKYLSSLISVQFSNQGDNIISPLDSKDRRTHLYMYNESNTSKDFFVDIWWDDPDRNIHIKRLGIIRPNQQVVIFDFPWDAANQKFSEIGYPAGTHKNRTYRLYIKELESVSSRHLVDVAKLCFNNNIIHVYTAFREVRSYYNSTCTYYFDREFSYDYHTGTSVIAGDKRCSDWSYKSCWDGVTNNKIENMKYDFEYEWDENYRLSKVYYTSKDGKDKITVVLGYDSEGKVVKLTKTVPESMSVNGQTTYEISVDGNTITYPGGRTSTKTQSAPAGGARTVTITEMAPDAGAVENKYEYSDNEQLLKYTRTANGSSAVTNYTYHNGSGTYPNGSRVDQKLKSVAYPDGSWKYYEYNSDGYVEKVYSSSSSEDHPTPGNNTGTYTQYGYEKHEIINYFLPQTNNYYCSWGLLSYGFTTKASEWLQESLPLHKKPSTIIHFYDEKEVNRKLFSDIPDQYIMEKICPAKNSGWNDSTNLQFKTERLAGEIVNGTVLPWPYGFAIKKETSPTGEVSYTYSTEGTAYKIHDASSKCPINLQTIATAKDADGKDYRKVETLTNPWGIVESKVVTDLTSGKVISSAESEVDSFGRITKTAYLDGTKEQFLNYCLWGPQKVVDREGNTTEYVYTADGLLKTITGPQQTTELSYDALGNVTQRKVTANGMTLTETSTYDAQSRILTHTDSAGISRTYTYTGADVAMTSSDGKTMNIDYNIDGTVASVTGNSVSPVFYEYGSDAFGKWKRTISGENAQAGIWEKQYFNMLGKLRKTETSSGYYKNYVYDSKGRLSSTTDSNGNNMSLVYNGRSEVTSRTVNGVKTDYTYGYNTRDSKTTYKVTSSTPSTFGSITSEKETSIDGLDSWSTMNSRTDHTHTTRHGGGEYTVETTDFEGIITKISNKDDVNKFTMTAPTLNAKLNTDGFGKTTSTEARNQTTKYKYRKGSTQLTKITESDGKLTTMEYTPGKTDLSRMTLPGGDKLTPTFNKLGQIEKLTGTAPENFDVTKTFDVFGREINLQTDGAPGKINTIKGYDSATGALISKTIAGNNVYSINYYDDGRIDTVTQKVGTGSSVIKEYKYTSAPKYLFAGVDYNDSTPDITVSGHDATFGLPGAVSTAGVISYAFGYNNDLQITSANVTSAIAGNKNVSYTYENLRRKTMALGSNSVSYEYDATTKRLKKVISGNIEAEYEYVPNTANTIKKVTIKKGGQVVSTRTIALESNSDRVASVTNSNAASAVLNSFTYTYDDKGEIDKITREDGSSWTYAYDSRGQLAMARRYMGGKLRRGDKYEYEYDSITNVLKGGRTDTDGNFEFTATPNAFNNIQAKIVANKVMVSGEADENASIAVYIDGSTAAAKASRKGKEFFASLNADNAAGASVLKLHIAASSFDVNATPAFGGDQPGNVPGANVIKEIIGSLVVPQQNEVPIYDDGGRLLSNSLYTCTWDGENRLITTQSTVKNDGTNYVKTEYAYDHGGRRVSKKVHTSSDGSNWTLSRTHKFFYDTVTLGGSSSDFGLLTLEEVTDESSSTTKTYQYLWGPDVNGSYHGLGGVGGLIAVINITDNKVYVPQMDAKGTVYKYIDADTGAVAAEFDYDPYGRIMRRSGDQVANLSLRYQTKYHDTETNSYYYGIRHYDPATCRWFSRDPLEEEGGYNLYAFVNNDPINNVDYLGMVSLEDPEWHHYIQKDKDTLDFFRKRGMKGKAFTKFRNSKGMGIIVDAADHRLTKEALHSNKWKDEFLKALENVVGDSKRITRKHIAATVENLKTQNKFKVLSNGFTANMGYKAWGYKMKTVKRFKKVVTNLLKIRKSRVTASQALIRKTNIAKRLAKKGMRKIPIIGAAFIAYSYYDYKSSGMNNYEISLNMAKDASILGAVYDVGEYTSDEAWSMGEYLSSQSAAGDHLRRIRNGVNNDFGRRKSGGKDNMDAFMESVLSRGGSDASASAIGR